MGRYVEGKDDGWWCEECGESFYESHYHCANCGEVCGMMGHYDLTIKGFTCKKKEKND